MATSTSPSIPKLSTTQCQSVGANQTPCKNYLSSKEVNELADKSKIYCRDHQWKLTQTKPSLLNQQSATPVSATKDKTVSRKCHQNVEGEGDDVQCTNEVNDSESGLFCDEHSNSQVESAAKMYSDQLNQTEIESPTVNSSNESESKSQLISSPPTPVSSSNSEKKHSETSDATDTSEHEGDETIDPVDFTAWANQNHTENLIDFAQILINNFDSETGELKQLNATDQQTFDHANEMSLKMYGDGVVEHGQIEQIGKTEHKVFDRRACCFAQFPVLAMGDCLVDSLLVGMIGVRFYEAGEEEVKDRSAKFRIELAEFVQLNRAALQKAIYDYEPDESESMDKIIAELKKPYVHLRDIPIAVIFAEYTNTQVIIYRDSFHPIRRQPETEKSTHPISSNSSIPYITIIPRLNLHDSKRFPQLRIHGVRHRTMGRTGHNYALLYLPTLSLIPSIYSLKYIDPAYIVSYTIKKHPSTSSTTTVVIWSPHLTDIVMFNSCCKVGNVSEWSTGDDGLLNVPDHAVWVSLGSFIIISTTINGNDQSTHCTSSSLWYVMEMNGEIVDKSYEKQVTNIPTKVQKITMTVNQQKHYRKYGKQALLALMIQNCIKQTKNVSEKNFRSFSANQNPLTKHQLALIISDDWFGVHAPSLITNTWKTLECLPINVSPNINLDLNVTDEIVSWQMSSRRIHNDLVSPEPANLNSLVDDVDYDFKLPNHDELEETMQQLNDQIKQNEKAKSSKHIKDMEIYVEKNSNKKKTRVKKNTVNDSDVEVLENHVTPRPKRNKVESKSEASSASSGNSAAVNATPYKIFLKVHHNDLLKYVKQVNPDSLKSKKNGKNNEKSAVKSFVAKYHIWTNLAEAQKQKYHSEYASTYLSSKRQTIGLRNAIFHFPTAVQPSIDQAILDDNSISEQFQPKKRLNYQESDSDSDDRKTTNAPIVSKTLAKNDEIKKLKQQLKEKEKEMEMKAKATEKEMEKLRKENIQKEKVKQAEIDKIKKQSASTTKQVPISVSSPSPTPSPSPGSESAAAVAVQRSRSGASTPAKRVKSGDSTPNKRFRQHSSHSKHHSDSDSPRQFRSNKSRQDSPGHRQSKSRSRSSDRRHNEQFTSNDITSIELLSYESGDIFSEDELNHRILQKQAAKKRAKRNQTGETHSYHSADLAARILQKKQAIANFKNGKRIKKNRSSFNPAYSAYPAAAVESDHSESDQSITPTTARQSRRSSYASSVPSRYHSHRHQSRQIEPIHHHEEFESKEYHVEAVPINTYIKQALKQVVNLATQDERLAQQEEQIKRLNQQQRDSLNEKRVADVWKC